MMIMITRSQCASVIGCCCCCRCCCYEQDDGPKYSQHNRKSLNNPLLDHSSVALHEEREREKKGRKKKKKKKKKEGPFEWQIREWSTAIDHQDDAARVRVRVWEERFSPTLSLSLCMSMWSDRLVRAIFFQLQKGIPQPINHHHHPVLSSVVSLSLSFVWKEKKKKRNLINTHTKKRLTLKWSLTSRSRSITRIWNGSSSSSGGGIVCGGAGVMYWWWILNTIRASTRIGRWVSAATDTSFGTLFIFSNEKPKKTASHHNSTIAYVLLMDWVSFTDWCS